MIDRRQTLALLGAPTALVAAAAFLDVPRALAAARARAKQGGTPDEIARDEDFWSEIAAAFTMDRSVVNLNNGGVSPSPLVVQRAMQRHLDFANTQPTAHALWAIQEPQREGARQRVAREWGVDPGEIAFTRNASESLQACQLGVDLRPGDEVLTTTQDYPRMLTTFRQRVRREGIVLREVALPPKEAPPSDVVRAFEEGLTERTRLILACHVVNLTGRILPVAEIARLGRAHGVPTIIDGAHSFANVHFKLPDLECDYFASSLHKWLFAPVGTGLLFVRAARIAGLWPLMAAPDTMDSDIRKFEEIGTHPAANALAIAEALTFHQALGGERKEARLLALRDRWAKRLEAVPRVRLMSSLEKGRNCGLATVDVAGVAPGDLAAWLWKARRILVTSIDHPEVKGIRVTPSVYTTFEEIDRFADAVEQVARQGLPA